MSKLKFIGDIVFTEKYEKDGQEKKKHTNIGGLMQRDDGSYVIKMFGSWLNVYPPKATERDYAQAKQAVKETQVYNDIEEDEIPF